MSAGRPSPSAAWVRPARPRSPSPSRPARRRRPSPCTRAARRETRGPRAARRRRRHARSTHETLAEIAHVAVAGVHVQHAGLVAGGLRVGRRAAQHLRPIGRQPLDVLRVLAGMRKRMVQLGSARQRGGARGPGRGTRARRRRTRGARGAWIDSQVRTCPPWTSSTTARQQRGVRRLAARAAPRRAPAAAAGDRDVHGLAPGRLRGARPAPRRGAHPAQRRRRHHR